MWHLMNAPGSLHSMYGLFRTLILASLVLTVVALALAVYALTAK